MIIKRSDCKKNTLKELYALGRAARLADLFVGDNRHALSGVLYEKAVGEFARQNAAGHDSEGALERAGGGNYGLGGLGKNNCVRWR
jgi:hypothetical protein